MRLVQFWRDEPVGPGSREGKGELTTILTGGPYPCVKPGPIPPFAVVNDFIRAGGTGGGMNGGWHWEPFEITPEEYEELVHELRGRPGYEVVDVPSWVTNRFDWYAWLLERRHGVDAAENLRLQKAAAAAKVAFEDARRGNDPEVTAQRYMEWVQAEREAHEFALPASMLSDGGRFRQQQRPLLDAAARKNAARIRGDEAAVRATDEEIEQLEHNIGEPGDES